MHPVLMQAVAALTPISHTAILTLGKINVNGKKSLMNIRKVKNKLADIWQEFKEVEIVYLFGSHVTGEARKTSDIDIAISAPKLTLDGYCKLWAKITKTLGTGKIDLVTMSDKPASFRYQVIREGNVIYCKDEYLLNDFELKTWQTYMDRKHLRGIYLKYLREGLSHGV